MSFRSPDCACLSELAREGEAEGFRFLPRLMDEWSSGANRFDQPGEAFFIVTDGGPIVAVCGLNIDPYQTDPGVARLRHLYVRRPARNVGWPAPGPRGSQSL